MLRIRLRRTGRRKAPSYRMVVAHGRDPRDGDFVEIVGHYNPAASPKTLELKEERIHHWLSVGAKPSETVHRLLHSRGLIEAEPPKRVTKPSRAEVEAAEAAARAEAEAAAAATEASAEASAAGDSAADEGDASAESAADGDGAEKTEG